MFVILFLEMSKSHRHHSSCARPTGSHRLPADGSLPGADGMLRGFQFSSEYSSKVVGVPEGALPRRLFLLLLIVSPAPHRPTSHMTEQLLALSLRRSEATAARSGRPGMCEMRLLARVALLRFMFLLLLLMQASVAT